MLAYNEQLYPFHKWFLKVLEGVPGKPENIMEEITAALENRGQDDVERFIASVKGFTDWGVGEREWPKYLMSGEDIGCNEADL